MTPPHARRRRRSSSGNSTSGHWTLNRHLAFACLATAAFGSLLGVSAECLRHADQSRINKFLSDGGPDTKIQLCQGQTYDITSPIIFTAKNQEISTEGYPGEEELKARIVLRRDWTKGEGLLGGQRRGTSGEGAAVIGDCRRCAHVALRNLIIDGNRAKLGRVLPTDSPEEPSPLVLLGNNEGQVVSGCTIRDPRGWTAIQLREGDNLSCVGAVIEDNKIGPAGEEWIEAVDGDDPENSPAGRPLASGLSLACRSSTVQRNSFIDTTDAAIVIYGSPGSLVASNHILSSTRSQMAGILMADLEPFEGDYTDTRVLNNTVEAEENALMRVAIGLGAAVLSDDLETMIRGGVVRGNKIRGIGMGYGIAASGLENFTVTENESTARHGGKRGAKCLEHGVVRNPLPTAFLRNERYIEGGEWQEDFIQGEFSYIVCIDPDAVEADARPTPESDAESGRVQEPPAKEAIAVRDPALKAPSPETEEEQEPISSEETPHNAVFDDILSHSQARMLESIADLGKNVDLLLGKALVGNSVGGGRDKGKGRISLEEEGGEILAQLAELSSRIARLESERSSLRRTIEGVDQELSALGQTLARTESQESESVNDVLGLLTNSVQRRKTETEELEASTALTEDSWVLPLVYLVGGQVIMVLVALIWTNVRRKSKGHKNI
ncbi:hypothetical protein NCC49_005384 [Naganishia albida]|nr:hypothetical protein NCC49_005384 [Naganishia albida]